MRIKINMVPTFRVLNRGVLLNFSNIHVRNIKFPAWKLFLMLTPVPSSVFFNKKTWFVLQILKRAIFTSSGHDFFEARDHLPHKSFCGEVWFRQNILKHVCQGKIHAFFVTKHLPNVFRTPC